MFPRPLVSIVVPVHNDEATLAASLASALSQTLHQIEIICVDDASTDASASVVERMTRHDGRIRLIRVAENRTALHARRIGIEEARADYVLFLDGDDELVPKAAETALREAQRSDADLVGFGTFVVDRNGHTGGSYERRLAPKHRSLRGSDVIRGLFPLGKPAQGQLWRNLYRTEILRRAYALVPEDLALVRMNDLPLLFIVSALARSYVSLPTRLYRYHFGRGGSGHRIDDPAIAEFYASGIDAVDGIAEAVRHAEGWSVDPAAVRAAYASARASIIGYVCDQIARSARDELRTAGFERVYARVAARDIGQAVATFYPAALGALQRYGELVSLASVPVRSVALVTMALTTGGISNVLSVQARILRDAGHHVTIVVRGAVKDHSLVPEDVDIYKLDGRDRRARLANWVNFLVGHDVDIVIDHEILSGLDWHEYARMSRAVGVPTIGWIHNFGLRPLLDGTARISALREMLPILRTVVTLSPLDVAFWKSLDVTHVFHLPNPPSPMMLDASVGRGNRHAPRSRIELVWVGRLEQRTKQTLELIRIAEQLKRRGADFRLTVVGPDWVDLTARAFNAMVARRRLTDCVRAIGPLRGPALVNVLDRAHLFLSTSAIEGYQLTIAEAQSRGLPVCMYSLPWLPLVQGNDGIIEVPQRDSAGFADAVVAVVRDAERYEHASRAAFTAAARATAHDYGELYTALLTDALPEDLSPDPTADDLRTLLQMAISYSELGSSFPQKKSKHANGRQRLLSLGQRVVKAVPALSPIAERAKQTLLRP